MEDAGPACGLPDLTSGPRRLEGGPGLLELLIAHRALARGLENTGLGAEQGFNGRGKVGNHCRRDDHRAVPVGMDEIALIDIQPENARAGLAKSTT